MREPFIYKIAVLFGLLLSYHSLFADVSSHTLSEPSRVQKSEDFYQKQIKNNNNVSSTNLERLERQVNAKHAFDSQDWYGSRYAFYRVLADNQKDFQAWVLLCETFISLQQYDTYQNFDEELEASLAKAYQTAENNLDKAVVSWIASQTKLKFEDLRQSALNLAKQQDIESRLQVLNKNYPREFAPYSLDIPQRADMASACIAWTYPLVKTRNFHYEDYISLTPKVKDLSVIARGNQLCLEGLSFGANYQLSFKAGLPGDGVKLSEAQALNLFIPHRKPVIRFRERGYILASNSPQIVPFVAVNVSEVKIKIIHVPERNIQSIQSNWFTNRLSRWDSDNLQEEQGQTLWQGTYRFPTEIDKTAISGLEIDKMIGKKLQPGVYVIEARVAENSYDNDEFASQALVISDIGLSTYQGPDGLHVYARSLDSAKVLSGVEITLIARNNRELSKLKTGSDGRATFNEQLINGKGGNTPAFITASHQGKQFTILNLRNESFDLSDRGTKGRSTTGAVEGYITTERGIYRPGETVHHICLLRNTKGQAVTKLPLTVKLYRPDGVIAQETVLQDVGNGGYTFDYPISGQAQTGLWTAAIFVDAKGAEMNHVSFEVNDFVPPRIEVKASSTNQSATPGQASMVKVNAQYYFGPPGANLKVEAESKLITATDPFPQWKGYQFGLIEEKWTPQRFKLPSAVTDAQGLASITTKIDLVPQTTHPLQLETTATVFEIGGRAQSAKLITNYWHQPYAIGISPRFKGNTAKNNSEAVFDIIAINQKGELQKAPNLHYALYEEQHDYVWFRSNLNWQYEVVTRDKVIANGKITLEEKEPTALKLPVQYGPYRLEVIDEKTGVATSVRFSAGWYSTDEAPDRPDMLEMEFSKDDTHPDKATVFIKSPFSGELFVAWAGETFQAVHTGKIGQEGLTLEIPIKKDQSHGNYLLATVYKPSDVNSSQMPGRAIGVAWLEHKQMAVKHKIDVTLEHPEIVKSGAKVNVTVKTPKAQKDLRLVVALVDEGTLSLTNFKSPDPYGYFFAQKNLNFQLRDSYGLLINPYGAHPGSFEVGGGETVLSRALTQLPARAYKVVSLYSGIIEGKGKDSISIPFNLPAYSGKLRVMAIAWTENGIGHAQSHLTVRDEVDLYPVLPRFLAPGDTAQIPFIIKNVDAPVGNYVMDFKTNNSEISKKFTLKKGEELRLPYELNFNDNGIKNIKSTLKGPNNFSLNRDWQLSVRPKVQSISLSHYGKLDPNASLTLDATLLKDFQEQNSQATLAIGSLPELGSAELIKELLAYPYYCLEQTTSRLFATALSNTEKKEESLQKEFNQLSSLQKIDGSFSLWSFGGSTEPWLTLYASDVLSDLKAKGITVPVALNLQLHHWIKEASQRSIHQPEDISVIAYAHYMLAKEGQGQLRTLRFFTDSHEKEIVMRHDMAFIAGAFAYYGDATNAAKWFDKSIAQTNDKSQNLKCFGSDLRNTAILVTLLAQSSEHHPKLIALTQELVDKARDAHYLSTQEKAWLIKADNALKDSRKDYQFTLAQKSQTGSATFNAHFSNEALKKTVVLQNTGKNPIYYALSLSGEPIDVKALPQQGFEIKRAVYTLAGQPVDIENLKSGELYVVNIKGHRTKEGLHHVLVVDLLPGGFEIENAKIDLRDDQQLSWLGSLTNTSRIEGRDDRFMAAYELGSQNDINAAYMVRAITPGTYSYPPLLCEAMYQPQYFTYGDEQKISIKAG